MKIRFFQILSIVEKKLLCYIEIVIKNLKE